MTINHQVSNATHFQEKNSWTRACEERVKACNEQSGVASYAKASTYAVLMLGALTRDLSVHAGETVYGTVVVVSKSAFSLIGFDSLFPKGYSWRTQVWHIQQFVRHLVALGMVAFTLPVAVFVPRIVVKECDLVLEKPVALPKKGEPDPSQPAPTGNVTVTKEKTKSWLQQTWVDTTHWAEANQTALWAVAGFTAAAGVSALAYWYFSAAENPPTNNPPGQLNNGSKESILSSPLISPPPSPSISPSISPLISPPPSPLISPSISPSPSNSLMPTKSVVLSPPQSPTTSKTPSISLNPIPTFGNPEITSSPKPFHTPVYSNYTTPGVGSTLRSAFTTLMSFGGIGAGVWWLTSRARTSEERIQNYTAQINYKGIDEQAKQGLINDAGPIADNCVVGINQGDFQNEAKLAAQAAALGVYANQRNPSIADHHDIAQLAGIDAVITCLEQHLMSDNHPERIRDAFVASLRAFGGNEVDLAEWRRLYLGALKAAVANNAINIVAANVVQPSFSLEAFASYYANTFYGPQPAWYTTGYFKWLATRSPFFLWQQPALTGNGLADKVENLLGLQAPNQA